MKPRLTLGLPVFNGSDYLRSTLDSLRAQTFEDWELIIADNASEDDTVSIIKEFAAADDRIRWIKHPTNIGAHRNYNSMVPEAHGEYFKWMAHDDLLAPTHLERCIAELDARPEVVLAFTGTLTIDEHDEVIDELVSTKSYEGDSPYERLRAYTGDRMRSPQIFGVMRRSTLLETPLLRNHAGSDYTFLQEMALRGKFAKISDQLFLYRIHPQRYSELPASERARWYDPDRSAPMLASWKRLGGMLAAIRRVPMPPGDKVRCLIFAARWSVRNGRDLVGDVWERARYEVGRVGSIRRKPA